MSNMSAGQIIGGVVGAVAGYFVGNPMLGFTLGSALGGAIDPPQLPGAEGPRIDEGPDLQATVGRAIPITFGTIPVTGIDIWVARYPDGRRYVEHDTTETLGGKGGPEQDVRTYSYSTSYAKIFGEGQKAALLMIRRNGEIVYDARPRLPDESDQDLMARQAACEGYRSKIEIYLGTDDQMPSPTMEASLGIGNVPAYRGRHYIVWIDDDVTDTRTLPPQIDATFSDVANEIMTTSTVLASDVLYPWERANPDPRNCKNTHQYSLSSSFSGTTYGTLAAALAAAGKADVIGWGPAYGQVNWGVVHDPMERQTVVAYAANTQWPETHAEGDRFVIGPGVMMCNAGNAARSANVEPLEPFGVFRTETLNIGQWVEVTCSVIPDCPPGSFDCNACGPYQTCGPITNMWTLRTWLIEACTLIYCRRVPRPPDSPCFPACETPHPSLPENSAYCVADGRIEPKTGYGYHASTYRWLSLYAVSGMPPSVTRYPSGPVLHSSDADYGNKTFWDAAYTSAVAAGQLPAGLTYSASGTGGVNTYPRNATYAYRRSYNFTAVDYQQVPLSSILSRLCARSGLAAADIDVSNLAATMVGAYRITNAATARACIEQLRYIGLYDVVDADKLTFPIRGQAAVRTFNEAEIGAYYSGESPPARIAPERTQDVELPRALRLHYLSSDGMFAPSMQQDQRIITRSEQLLDVSLPVVLGDDRAAQLAQIWLTEAHIARERYVTAAGPRDLALLPGDAVSVPVDGQPTRARILEKRMGLPGVVSLTLQRDDISAYSSNRTGVRGDAPTGTIRPIAGPTQMVIIDGPALTEQSNDAGFHVAMRGVLKGWRGATLYRSVDGATFAEQIAIRTPTPIGVVADVLPHYPPYIIDTVNALTVDLPAGVALQSVTELAMLDGQNTAFVGVPGRWELVGFMSATQIAPGRWQLASLLRGRRGTEQNAALHQAGDTFVLNGPGVYRMPLVADDIGRPIILRAVTFGTQLDVAPDVLVTPTGMALECYAPCQIEGVRLDNGDISIHWLRRARYSGEWRDYVDVPLNESFERYEVDVLDGAGVVVRTLAVSVPTALYTAAQIAADFGSPPVAIDIRVYQLSATVGRGFPGVAIV